MFSVTGDVQYNKVANHDTLIQAIVTSLTHYSTEYCSALRAQSSEMWESTEAIDQAVDFSSTSANGVGQVQYLTMVIDNISWYEGIWRRDDVEGAIGSESTEALLGGHCPRRGTSSKRIG